ncbi:MAG TPA: hypothetical protein VGM88_21775 [Kofleriaceae bacterium]|jgi:hypothetical protein
MRAVLVSAVLCLAACDHGTVVDVDVSDVSGAYSVELYVGDKACTDDCAGVLGPGMTTVSPGDKLYYRAKAAAYTAEFAGDDATFHLETASGQTKVAMLLAIVRDDQDNAVGYAKLDDAPVGQGERTLHLAAASMAGFAVHAWAAPVHAGVRCAVLEDLGTPDNTIAIVDPDDPDCDDIASTDECEGESDTTQADLPQGGVCTIEGADTSSPVCRLGRDCAGGACDAPDDMCMFAAGCQCPKADLACLESQDPLLECHAAPPVGGDCTGETVTFDLSRLPSCALMSPPLVVGDAPGLTLADLGTTTTFASHAKLSTDFSGCSASLTVTNHDPSSTAIDRGLVAFTVANGNTIILPFTIRHDGIAQCTGHNTPTINPCEPLVGIAGDQGDLDSVWTCAGQTD